MIIAEGLYLHFEEGRPTTVEVHRPTPPEHAEIAQAAALCGISLTLGPWHRFDRSTGSDTWETAWRAGVVSFWTAKRRTG